MIRGWPACGVQVRIDHYGEELLIIRSLPARGVQVRIDHCGEELLHAVCKYVWTTVVRRC